MPPVPVRASNIAQFCRSVEPSRVYYPGNRRRNSAGLNRESLYRQLSRRGNPSLNSLNAVLTALGLKLRFAAG